jgi:hypothetical protein
LAAIGCALRGLQVDKNRVDVPHATAANARLATTLYVDQRREMFFLFICVTPV